MHLEFVSVLLLAASAAPLEKRGWGDMAKDMAKATGGVVVGNVIGNGVIAGGQAIGGALGFGQQSSNLPADRPQPSVVQVSAPAAASHCEQEMKAFMGCMDSTGNDSAKCQFYQQGVRSCQGTRR